MKDWLAIVVLVGATGSVNAAEQVATMRSQLPAMQMVRPPSIDSIGARTTPRQYYMPDNIDLSLSGMGVPGQVRVSLHPFTVFPPGSALAAAGMTPMSDCSFEGVSMQAPAVIGGDGRAIARFSGYWIPKRRDLVGRDGNCRFEVRVARMQANLSYREEARLVSDAVKVVGHETVRIANTARLRGFLKPFSSPRCTADDAGDKFGIRLTASAVSHACRTDFLKVSGDSQSGPTGNPLGPGTIVNAVVWKLEGDTGRCELCSNPLSPCRGISPQATFAESIGYEAVRWVYAPVRAGEIGNGYRYAAFAGPPGTRSGSLIRIDARDYDYDSSLPDYLERLHSVVVGNAPGYEAAIIGRADAQWRSWMRPFGIGMACSAWTPPAPSAAKSTVSTVVGQIAQGQAPTLPAAPYLRLLLDELYVQRPVGQRLPWD
jgi:hypothetical protein